MKKTGHTASWLNWFIEVHDHEVHGDHDDQPNHNDLHGYLDHDDHLDYDGHLDYDYQCIFKDVGGCTMYTSKLEIVWSPIRLCKEVGGYLTMSPDVRSNHQWMNDSVRYVGIELQGQLKMII